MSQKVFTEAHRSALRQEKLSELAVLFFDNQRGKECCSGQAIYLGSKTPELYLTWDLMHHVWLFLAGRASYG